MPEQPETKEESFEDWLKRLASEPLKPVEETEKREQYHGNMWSKDMVDPEEIEKEQYQDKGNLLQKKFRLLKEEYDQTGRTDRAIERKIEGLEKEFEENRLEGIVYEGLEKEFTKFKKETEEDKPLKYG